MPAFDPVRDAALNSPVTHPSITRRATDLAVLLNSDSQGPRTPGSARPSSLSHLLSDDAMPATPNIGINKLSSPSRTIPSPDMSQPPSASLPATSSVPYNPRNRKTPAGSVLVPMTPQEMEMYKRYRGIGTQTLLAKRKRERSMSPDDLPQPSAKRHAGDVGRVVNHYNMRPEVGVKQRLRSPIIGLKNFNNWVKSVLITRFVHPILSSSTPSESSGKRGKVLDMGCGKGGDLTKWEKARVRELIGVDIADVSIEQARQRWETMRQPRFAASFAALDCYTKPLSNAFPPEKLAQPFDVVSMQFCMHYAFETVEKARCMLQNVSQWLRKGGVFVGTIPNAEYLLERLDALPPSATQLSFGNSVYSIRFEDRHPRPLFGHRYFFWLEDAVDNVPEYLVHWNNFVGLAAEYSLYPKYKEEFHQIFTEHRHHKEFESLLLRMKVVDANGESAMDEDQWEAANIYVGFVFEKR
ncbi:mRNA capping enzyme-domain-containing protein [Scleroderma citrinum]